MNNFSRNDRPRGNRDFNQMHSAVCSQCGANCQVPFRPTGEKPVYCSDCFEKLGNNSNSWSYKDNNQGRSSFGDRRPSGNRNFGGDRGFGGNRDGGRNFGGNRSFGDRTFENKNAQKAPDNKQMELVSKKLDRIIDLLENQKSAPMPSEKKVDKKIAKKVSKKVKAKKKVEKVA